MKIKKPGRGFALPNNYRSALRIALFLFISLTAKSQILFHVDNFGFQWERGNFKNTLFFPTGCGSPSLQMISQNAADSAAAAIYFDSCGHRLFVYDPSAKTWAETGGGSGSGVDSVTISHFQFIDSLKYWVGATAHIIGTINKVNGLNHGGEVTHTSGTTFHINAAHYIIAGFEYDSPDTTITLSALPSIPDSDRVDAFFVGINKKVDHSTGIGGSPVPRPIDVTTQFALVYINMRDTGFSFQSDSLWVKGPGNVLTQAGGTNGVQMYGIVNIGAGAQINTGADYDISDHFKMTTKGRTMGFRFADPHLFSLHDYIRGADVIGVDSTGHLYLPATTTSNAATVKNLVEDTVTHKISWQVSGGGSVGTLQQGFDAAPTASPQINTGGRDFSITNATSFNLTTQGTNGGLMINESPTQSTFFQGDGTSGIAQFYLNDTTSSILATRNSDSQSNNVKVFPSKTVFFASNPNDTVDIQILNPPIQTSPTYVAAFRDADDALVKVPFPSGSGASPSSIRDSILAHTISPKFAGNLFWRPVDSTIIDSSAALGGIPFYDPTTGIKTATSNATLDNSGNLTVAGTINGVKKYVVLLSQSGTSAPDATVLENTLGGTVVWTYLAQGRYAATLTGGFPVGKTVIQTSNVGDIINDWISISAQRASSDEIDLFVVDTGSDNDTVLDNTPFTILVYP